MLQAIFKLDQNLLSFLLQNWSKFNQKSIKKCYPIQSWFCNGYFSGFCLIFAKFWTNFGCKIVSKTAKISRCDRGTHSKNVFGCLEASKIDFRLIFQPPTTKNSIWPQQNALRCSFWMWKPKVFATRFLTSLPFFNQKGPLGVENWYQMTTFALAGTLFPWVSAK